MSLCYRISLCALHWQCFPPQAFRYTAAVFVLRYRSSVKIKQTFYFPLTIVWTFRELCNFQVTATETGSAPSQLSTDIRVDCTGPYQIAAFSPERQHESSGEMKIDSLVIGELIHVLIMGFREARFGQHSEESWCVGVFLSCTQSHIMCEPPYQHRNLL